MPWFLEPPDLILPTQTYPWQHWGGIWTVCGVSTSRNIICWCIYQRASSIEMHHWCFCGAFGKMKWNVFSRFYSKMSRPSYKSRPCSFLGLSCLEIHIHQSASSNKMYHWCFWGAFGKMKWNIFSFFSLKCQGLHRNLDHVVSWVCPDISFHCTLVPGDGCNTRW